MQETLGRKICTAVNGLLTTGHWVVAWTDYMLFNTIGIELGKLSKAKQHQIKTKQKTQNNLTFEINWSFGNHVLA